MMSVLPRDYTGVAQLGPPLPGDLCVRPSVVLPPRVAPPVSVRKKVSPPADRGRATGERSSGPNYQPGPHTASAPIEAVASKQHNRAPAGHALLHCPTVFFPAQPGTPSSRPAGNQDSARAMHQHGGTMDFALPRPRVPFLAPRFPPIHRPSSALHRIC